MALFVSGLLFAALSGTCTVINGRSIFSASPSDRGYAGIFVYFGSLIFGALLAGSALAWRKMARQMWGHATNAVRLSVRLLFGFAFLVVALALMVPVAPDLMKSPAQVIPLLIFMGLPAAVFVYGAYRCWGPRAKA